MNVAKPLRILVLGTLLLSCSGEDGERGPEGPQGESITGKQGSPGINCWDRNGNGTGDITNDEDNEDLNGDNVVNTLDCQGATGDAGENGNANVSYVDVSLSDFDNSSELVYTLGPDLLPISDHTYLVYLKNFDDLWFQVPGGIFESNIVYTRSYFNEVEGTLVINFYFTNSDELVDIAQGNLVTLRIIAIALDTNSKSDQTTVLSELKTAGVDVNDYHAVADYFGLE